MKEILMIVAATMSKESIMETLNKSLSKYNEAVLLGNEESIKEANEEMFVSTNMFIMNHVSKGDIKNAIKNLKEMEEIEKAHKFFQTTKN